MKYREGTNADVFHHLKATTPRPWMLYLNVLVEIPHQRRTIEQHLPLHLWGNIGGRMHESSANYPQGPIKEAARIPEDASNVAKSYATLLLGLHNPAPSLCR
jgi:hypothetical protein